MRRLVPILALSALPLAVPAPAGAAQIGTQAVLRAPALYPESLPGCGRPRCVRGRTIRRGWVVLARRVRLEAGERRARVRFRCPGGRHFRTFGIQQSGRVSMQIPDGQLPYTRRRRAVVVAERLLTPINRPSAGTLYALCA